MRSLARRLGAVALSTAVISGTALAAPAQAANYYGQTAGDWLSRQLTGGVVHNDQYDFDDYGLSLDVFFALKSLGRQDTAASVLNRIDDDPGAYIGSGTERYAGATGKLATAVEQQGRDPRSFGGVDLVGRLEQRVHTAADAQHGRAVDQSDYGDYSNTIGQSFAVRALAGVGSTLADDASGFLVKQQCTAGFFREGLTSADGSYSCDGGTAEQSTPSVDSTGFAVEALVAARAEGMAGLDDDIAQAADWLESQQRTDGSFVGNGTPNANSTGLAATALIRAGRTAAAERAGAWIARRAVIDAVAETNPALAREVGAIAYDDAALTAGKQVGIPVDARDQWRRSTAQAVLGANAVKSLRVTAPAGFQHGGSTITVGATGLAAGERFWFRLGNAASVRGTATSAGVASARLTLPSTTRNFVLQAMGTSSARTGRLPVTVLGPRTFGTRLRTAPIKAGGTQQVTVTGLAAAEPATLVYRGSAIWSGRASTTGTIVRSFAAGRTLGKQTLVVKGRFADRSASTYFRVVR